MAATAAETYRTAMGELSRMANLDVWYFETSIDVLKSFLDEVLELEHFQTFRTENPNIDIRHGGNFTGPRRGRKRRYELPYWGKLEDHINGKCTEEADRRVSGAAH